MLGYGFPLQVVLFFLLILTIDLALVYLQGEATTGPKFLVFPFVAVQINFFDILVLPYSTVDGIL